MKKIRNLVCLLFAGSAILFGQVDQHYHAYMWARYCHAQGDESGAYHSYQFLLKNNPSPHIYPSFIEYLFDTGQYQAVAHITPTMNKLIKMPYKTTLLLIQSLQTLGLYSQALSQMESLLKDAAGDPEVVYIATQLYLQSNNITQALRLVEQFLESERAFEHAPLFRLLQAQAFMLLQKYEPAKESLHAALAARPAFDKALLLLGVIHELEGDHQEALKQYEHFLSVNGPHPVISEQIRRLQQHPK